MKYGSKDLMRIQDIRKRSGGDLLQEMEMAFRMAQEIEIPGKAIARGFASLEVYQTKYSPVAAIFFDRACKLTGEDDIRDIQAMASMNTIHNEDEAEEVYSNIPMEKQPASRWPENERTKANGKKAPSTIESCGKVNVVKGEGPQINIHQFKVGTVEVWKSADNKVKLMYTASPEPNYNIGDAHDFKFVTESGLSCWEQWTMVDYIDANAMVNLMPLYGTTLPIYNYN